MFLRGVLLELSLCGSLGVRLGDTGLLVPFANWIVGVRPDFTVAACGLNFPFELRVEGMGPDFVGDQASRSTQH